MKDIFNVNVKSSREVNLKDIMQEAYEKHIVVPAFNVPYLPMIKPVVDSLKEFETFGLVEVARPDIEKFGAESLRAVADEFYKCADRKYVRLHQDHVPVIDEDGQRVDWQTLIQEALDLDFDSVMVDGSRLSFEENLEISRIVVGMAHRRGVCVEAELGAVLGHEEGPLPPYEELFATGKGFTDPQQAKMFVEKSGIDWLSVAVGSVHGAICGAAKDAKKVEARINIEHLYKIFELTQKPLVLHGGSGIKQVSVLKAVQNGITKINVCTTIRQTYEQALKEKNDINYAQTALRDQMEDIIKNHYHIQGSANKLNTVA